MASQETPSTTYTIENGILISTLRPDHVMDVNDAQLNAQARANLGISSPLPILMDIRQLKHMSFEAIFATAKAPDVKNYSAAALLITNTMHEIVAKESKLFHDSAIPYRVFTDKEQALSWLSKYVK